MSRHININVELKFRVHKYQGTALKLQFQKHEEVLLKGEKNSDYSQMSRYFGDQILMN